MRLIVQVVCLPILLALCIATWLASEVDWYDAEYRLETLTLDFEMWLR